MLVYPGHGFRLACDYLTRTGEGRRISEEAMKISSSFDSGNIEVVEADDPADVRLRIRRDTAADFFQWFHFRASGVRGLDCRFSILNAAEASYPKGWAGYRACASYDRSRWFRVATEYEDGVLSFRLRPERDSVYFAYFAPYSRERHRDFIASCLESPRASLDILGESVKGDELDLLVIRDPAVLRTGRRACWVVGRQHPGETMAQWWMEGFVGRLLDPADETARAVLAGAVLYVVPNMNPDGSVEGNLRTNAAGANLNREWMEPTMERSPEVFLVRRRMTETGVDFALDVHGDEGLPYVFIAGGDNVPSMSDRQRRLQAAYFEALSQANPDFQTEHGYPKGGEPNLTLCANYLAETFGCLGMTLEMPFKDNANAPDADEGWSPARCRRLGTDCVSALASVLADLR
jgi:murein tripeptide amidase MpaA